MSFPRVRKQARDSGSQKHRGKPGKQLFVVCSRCLPAHVGGSRFVSHKPRSRKCSEELACPLVIAITVISTRPANYIFASLFQEISMTLYSPLVKIFVPCPINAGHYKAYALGYQRESQIHSPSGITAPPPLFAQ